MPIYKFSPNLASAEERSETFVAREAVLEDLLDRVRKIESGARHCVLIGPRGIGKTHLLLLLKDRVVADESLASQWEVIRFSEEEYSITNLAELLLRIIELMPGDKPENMGSDVDLALAYILDFSANSGKRLLLLMDNIHLYFSQFPNADVGRLRDILTSGPTFFIVGAAPSYFKQMTGYEESFYDFFEPIHLNELVHSEVGKMLERRAEFEENQDLLAKLNGCQQEIRTVTHLTGGNPRLILMLYQVMCESDVMEAAEAFKQLLDELTPYFQGRMDGLPPQGRKVVDTLASMEVPSTPTELAEATGMQVNAVTSQLKRLKDGGYVQQVKRRRSKATRYEVTERLFRMWREMRTETGRKRLDILIRFLNLWYTPAQLLDETEKLLTQLGETQKHEKPRLLSHLQYLTEAIPILLRPELERVYSHARGGRLDSAMAKIPLLKELAGYKEVAEANPDDTMAWYNFGKALDRLNRHQEALENLDKATQLQPDFSAAWSSRGLVLISLGKYKEALASFYKVTQLQPNAAETLELAEAQISALEELIGFAEDAKAKTNDAIAWYNLGKALDGLNRHQEALESYDKAIQLQPDSTSFRNNRAATLDNLAPQLVEQIKDDDEESLELLIEKYLPKVYGRVHNLVPEADAQDVTQDIFLSLVDSIHSFRGKSTFSTWVHRITMNKVADYHRNTSRRKEQLTDNHPPRTVNLWNEADDALIVRKVLMELPETYRELLLLKFSDGLQFGEIAEKLGLSYAATRSRYEIALDACRELMDSGNASVSVGLPVIEAELSTSLQSLEADNLGSARHALRSAINSRKQADTDDFQSVLFAYLKESLKSGRIHFVKEAIEIIVSEIGTEYDELFHPFSLALDYMQTKDESILERLQQEVRELVLEIVEYARN